MSIPASAKYAIIREMTMRDNNRLISPGYAKQPVFPDPDTTVILKAKICGSSGNSTTAKNSSRFWKRISSGDTAKVPAAFICG